MKAGYNIFVRAASTVLWMLLLGSPIPLAAQREQGSVDLEALYRQIDEAILESPHYVELRERQIARQRQLFLEEDDLDRRFTLAEDLFASYKPYKNDSALHYAGLCISLADSLRRPDLAGRYRSLMARQCSNASMYVEALGLLSRVDKGRLDRQGLTDYYDAYMHVCGEIAAYSLLPEVRDRYFALQECYRDSVLLVVDQGSEEYLHLRMSALCARNLYQEALKVSDQWLNNVAEGTHADAYAAYYRHIVYDRLGNRDMVRYWLGKSAMADIRSAVMDQASLTTLAELLNSDGDTERSYRYIRFTWHCNNYFNTRLRSSQITPVLNVIERSYQTSADRQTRLLVAASVVFTLLSAVSVLLALVMFRQKRRLAQAHRDLLAANTEMAATNEKLTRMNSRVTKYNKQLFDIINSQ